MGQFACNNCPSSLSGFGSWGACSVTCGHGMKINISTPVVTTLEDNCPTQCGLWSKCSVTCGQGVQTRQSIDGDCESTVSCPNDPCPESTTSVVITTKTTFPTIAISTTTTTTKTTPTTSKTTRRTTEKTDNVTKWRSTTASTFTAATTRYETPSNAVPAHDLTKEDSLLGVKVAVPVVAAVVIISVVLVVLIIRRKRHNRLPNNFPSLNHLTSNEGLPHGADNTASKAVYQNVQDERDNTYTQPQREGSGPREHPYVELTGRASASSNVYEAPDQASPGAKIAPKTLQSLPSVEEHEYEYMKQI